MKRLLIASFVALASFGTKAQPRTEVCNSCPWTDTDGKTIEAHGGGMLKDGNTWYWYGENHALGVGNKTGISCYSSTDLINWKNEGVVLPKTELHEAFRDSGVCERPKVIYNARTKKYVMWMHLDGRSYTLAQAGVAVSKKPTGPFRFEHAFRPIVYDYGYARMDGGNEALTNADMQRIKQINEAAKGNTFRDMNLFADDDGSAWVLYSSENNNTLYIAQLNDQYTDIVRPAVEGVTWARAIVNGRREAPAPFKYNGRYYIISSGLTGWSPNPADYAVASHLLGPWTQMGNPCVGNGAETTFDAQSTFVLPAPHKPEGNFIFMADRWNGLELEKSTYLWLPFAIHADGSFKLHHIDQWNMSIFDTPAENLDKPVVAINGQTLSWQALAGAHGYNIYRNGVMIGNTAACSFALPPELAGQAFGYSVEAFSIRGTRSPWSLPVTVSWNNATDVYLSDIRPESSTQGFGALAFDKAIQGGKINIAGREFAKGLGTHAHSEIVYRLCASYNRFSAWVGIDQYANSVSTASSCIFQVWGDGKLLFSTQTMRGDTPAQQVEVNVSGVSELKLIVTEASDGSHYDHANWADARLEK